MKLTFAIIFIIFHFTFQQLVDDKPAMVDKLFEQYNKEGSAGCTVSVIKDGKFVYQNAFGLADIRNNFKNQKDSKFLIGSTTKQFTALSIGILEMEGKLKTTDPVAKYIPELKFKNITILNIIQHTSGLRDYLNLLLLKGKAPLFDLSRDEAFELIVNQQTLAFRTGTKWDYSNSGYVLMEYIIERVSKLPFNQFVKKNVLDPLNMKDTILSNNMNQIVPKGSYGYTVNPDGSLSYAPLVSNAILGAGGIQMTHADFLKYDRNFYDNKLSGGARLIDLITTVGQFANGTKHNYAFGLGIHKVNGIDIIEHNGAFPGYYTYFIRFPQYKLTTLMTSNIYDPAVYSKAAQAAQIYLTGFAKKNIELKPIVYDEMYKLKNFIPEKSFSSFRLEKFVGYYYLPDIDAAHHLYIKNGYLFLTIKDLGDIPFIFRSTGSNEFWLGQRNGISGRFLENRGVITGIFVKDFPRAENLMWKKLSNKPICKI
eukprot:gene1405-12025_t